MPFTGFAVTSPRGSLLPTIREREAQLTYRLIFKHPESGEKVASMDLVSSDEDAALARFTSIAGYLAGELWNGETRLRSIAPRRIESVQ